jgi:DNA replication protein DnaC
MELELDSNLKQLHLSGMASSLMGRLREAEAGRWSYGEFLARLTEDELERRGQAQLAARLKRATLNTTKTIESFDFNFNPTISRPQVLRLASLEFVRQKRNLLIYGLTGVGKSHLVQALGHEACRVGLNVLFTTTDKMLKHLAAGRADKSVERRLKLYLRPQLLILDDFALKALPPTGAEDLYEVVCGRYEVASIILTSNRAPEEWGDWLANPLLASALLDRLADKAESLAITGPSYRSRVVI